jgi:hypothetical protein
LDANTKLDELIEEQNGQQIDGRIIDELMQQNEEL